MLWGMFRMLHAKDDNSLATSRTVGGKRAERRGQARALSVPNCHSLICYPGTN